MAQWSVAISQCVLEMVSNSIKMPFSKVGDKRILRIHQHRRSPTVWDCQQPMWENLVGWGPAGVALSSSWEVPTQRLTVLEWHWELQAGSSSDTYPELGNTWKDLTFFLPVCPSPPSTSFYFLLASGCLSFGVGRPVCQSAPLLVCLSTCLSVSQCIYSHTK